MLVIIVFFKIIVKNKELKINHESKTKKNWTLIKLEFPLSEICKQKNIASTIVPNGKY